MGRNFRIEYYGAIYHIIHRGNNKAFIFDDNNDKIYLLKILSEVKEIFDFNILAYVIMDNHYHFLIKTHNIPISKVMHRINTRYAKYYNKKYERTGSPFEGRYRGILVQNELYLIRLVKYIHNNPVYGMICKCMTQYKWSSDMFYRMNLENIVDIDDLLDMFSEDRHRAIEKYKEVMNEVEDYSSLRDEFEAEEIIGTEKFKESIRRESKGLEARKKMSLDDILKLVCPTPLDYRLIKEGSRKRYLTEYKYRYIKKAMEQGYTTVEIGEALDITSSSIRKIIQ